MPLFVKFKSVLRNLFSSRHVDGDLDAEVRSRLAMLAGENIRAGMLPHEAQRRARIELGGIDQVKEQVSEIRIGHGCTPCSPTAATGLVRCGNRRDTQLRYE